MGEEIYIGLGSNLGDREQQLNGAVEALGRIDGAAVVRRSSLYESAPIGPPQQPRFLNAVVQIECDLVPQQLLGILKQIEVELGRKPAPKWEARAIDLDILLWGERVVADPNLQIPHLELHNRRFALEPLCELKGETRHPVLGSSMLMLLRPLLSQDVVRIPSSDFWGPSAREVSG
jgi:2-amino-4-hydroxy-6-hydroxymethyldihydropteridine diphosphokinase